MSRASRPRAKRSLSQNFLVDPNLQRKVVAELEARADEAVLEVGPGHGELTGHIVGVAGELVVVEKDTTLAAALESEWGHRPDVRVIRGDALRLDLAGLMPAGRPFRVISNVPYQITSPLLFAFLELEPIPRRVVATVQREVAERVVAQPGSRVYGALSVGVQTVARAEIAFGIGRRAFRPVPNVDSAVLRIDPIADRPTARSSRTLRRLTRAAFAMRRKQLQKILRSSPELGLSAEQAMALLEGLDIAPTDRPEMLAPERFVALAEALAEL